MNKAAEFLAIAGSMMAMEEYYDTHLSTYLDGGHHRRPKPTPTNRLSNDEIHKRKAKAKRRRRK